MKAIVKYIQVGGNWNAGSLEEACGLFVEKVPTRTKILFFIQCPDGEERVITIRDEDNQTVAYGDFAELPTFFEYAKEVEKEE